MEAHIEADALLEFRSCERSFSSTCKSTDEELLEVEKIEGKRYIICCCIF